MRRGFFLTNNVTFIAINGLVGLSLAPTMTLTSLSSGALITTQAGTWPNLGSLVPVGLTALALLWLALRRAELRRIVA